MRSRKQQELATGREDVLSYILLTTAKQCGSNLPLPLHSSFSLKVCSLTPFQNVWSFYSPTLSTSFFEDLGINLQRYVPSLMLPGVLRSVYLFLFIFFLYKK